MSRIRGNFKLVAAVVFIAVAIFILTAFFDRSNGGSSITTGLVHNEYVNAEDVEIAYQEMEARSPGARDGQSVSQMRLQAWQQVVQDKVLNAEYKSVGIDVSSDEVVSLIQGPFMSEEVKRDPQFQNREKGGVDTGMIVQFLNIVRKPDNSNSQHQQIVGYMRGVEKKVIRQRLIEKLVGILNGGVYVSTNQVTTMVKDESQSASFSFFGVPYTVIPENEIKVTDNDLRDFYNKNRERFKTENITAVVKYGFVPIVPSPSDSVDAQKELLVLKESLKDHKDDLIAYASKQTDIPFDTNYQSVDAIKGPQADAIIESDLKDTVLGPYFDGTAYKIFKVTGAQNLDEMLFKVRHILIKVQGTDSLAARKTANDLRAKANAGNFSELVAANSADQMTQASGGDLGWISKGSKGEKFYNPIKAAGVGKVAVTQSDEGIHVVLVEKSSGKKYQIVNIARTVAASDSTEEVLYQRASQFLSASIETGSLDSAAKKVPKILIQQSEELNPGSITLPQIKGGRPVIAWALHSNQGDISKSILDTDDAYVIATVVKKTNEGYRDFESIKDEIRAEVINELKAKKIMDKVKGLSKGDFKAMAAAYGAGALAESVGSLHFNDPQIPMIGDDPLVQGVIFGLKPGETSGVLQGKIGIYIVKTEAFTEAPAIPAEALKERKDKAQDKARQDYLGKAYQGMIEIAKVKDERYEREVKE